MRRVVAIGIPVLGAVSVIAAAWVDRVATQPFLDDLGWLPLSVACTGVGSLVWFRRAGRALGPLFMATGLSIALSLDLVAYADIAVARALPGAAWAAWAFQWSLAGGFMLFLILQLFPTGRPMTPRWGALVWLTVIAAAGNALAPALGVTTSFTRNFPRLVHPLQLLSAPTAGAFEVASQLLLTAVFVLSALEIVVRYHRSAGEQRAQMKWIAAASAVAAVGFVLGVVTPGDGPAVAFALLAPLIPIAAGIAIVHYRLYDIDVVISKTLVIALLAVFITVVYVAIVVGLGTLVPAGDLALSVAATTVVALLFQPAREWARRVANRLVFGVRATPYEVLAGFATRMADALSVDEVLPQMAEAAGRGVGATTASVRVLLPHGERVETWPPHASDTEAAASFPVTYQGAAVGEIAVTKPRSEPLTHAEQGLLRDLAGQAGLALHNVRLNEELAVRLVELDEQTVALRRSRERLVTARDAQRRGLQRDIHEGPERELRLIRRSLEATMSLVETDPTASAGQLDVLGERANETLEGLRDLARGIFPPLLADKGIQAALEAHIRKVGANATVDVDPAIGKARFDADIEACVYFCCLQAIQNVIRHAANTRCVVRLAARNEVLAFEIADEGPGFDPASTTRGMGLDIMQDRIDALEGLLEVRSAPGSGTTVSIRIPMREVTPA